MSLVFYCRGCGLPVEHLRMVWHPDCRKKAKREVLAQRRQLDQAKFATRASRKAIRLAKHQEPVTDATRPDVRPHRDIIGR